MRQGPLAPPVRRPSCLRLDVGRDDLFVQVRRHRGRARLNAYRPANNGSNEVGRKARRDGVFETRAAWIDQHDAAVTPAGRAFDQLTERFKYFRQRMAPRHHFKHSLFSGEKRFGPLLVVDISRQGVPKDNAPFRISQGEAAGVEPTVDAIRTATAAFAHIWLAGFERLLPGGEHPWAIIRMIAVDLPSTLQFLECRAEKFQAVAVGAYEVAIGIHEDDEGRKAIEKQ